MTPSRILFQLDAHDDPEVRTFDSTQAPEGRFVTRTVQTLRSAGPGTLQVQLAGPDAAHHLHRIAAQMVLHGVDVTLPALAPAPLHVRGAGVLLPADDGRILAFERADRDGLLGLPFGGVDPGETPRAAAERECLEETGIGVRCHDLPPYVATSDSGAGAATFLAQATGTQRPPSHAEEGQPVWVPPAALVTSGAFPVYNRAMLVWFGLLSPDAP